jgi:hypothetical protein
MVPAQNLPKVHRIGCLIPSAMADEEAAMIGAMVDGLALGWSKAGTSRSSTDRLRTGQSFTTSRCELVALNVDRSSR